jgi:putative hydrolase of the HAD superfamily
LSSSPQFDWGAVELVVFDVDGTLYRQAPLRIWMAAKLARAALARRSLHEATVIRRYRALRERLGSNEVADFEDVLARTVAGDLGCAPAEIREIVTDWIDRRPLPVLERMRYPGVDTVFDALRASGRTIGVLSDYPALDKIQALGLRADHVVSAADAGLLKPHPRGLEMLMDRAGADPRGTVLIGDRIDRDGEAARRAGVRFLLRTSRPVAGFACFSSYRDPVFAGVSEQRERR